MERPNWMQDNEMDETFLERLRVRKGIVFMMVSAEGSSQEVIELVIRVAEEKASCLASAALGPLP
jgi:hypothetical protein